MSEIPTNVVNCQKSDFRNLKIQIPPENLFSSGTLKSEPQDRTLWKILISPQNFGEKLHHVQVQVI